MGTSDDPLDRMLEVVRFWLTKDLKYAKGRPCKPYNSCLGEFFRCNWETEDNAPKIDTSSLQQTNGTSKGDKNASNVSLSVPQHGAAKDDKLIRVSYLTEQTSHHPPVSAFNVTCPEKGITARGFDQITAKFTGTSVKRDGETYQLTHPAAHLGGLLRGALSVSVSEFAYITCPKTKIKVILHYIDGVVFKYDPENDDKSRVQDVPDEDVLARLSGPWKEKVVFTLGPRPVYTIIDIAPLTVFFKHVTGNDGKPDLTEKGREVLERAQKGDWSLEGIM
ncbi:Oxysterol-binding protein-like protein 1 [Fusarium oxysporum]|nr:Oxysterol-binding protein-like protein 1 [Fusarium oxysporum]